MKIGVVHGRFQIFHNGHLEYILQGLAKSEYLVIGITNPDPDSTKFDSSNDQRAKAENNPFSFYERLRMIKQTMTELGVESDKYDIVPFPINYPERIHYYIPDSSVHYTRIYEPWNHKKVQILKEQGYTVEILYEGDPKSKTHEYTLPIDGIGKTQTLKVMSGTEVRELMTSNGNWRDFVPSGTARIIDDLNLIERLKSSE